jgi:hypothetical protein
MRALCVLLVVIVGCSSRRASLADDAAVGSGSPDAAVGDSGVTDTGPVVADTGVVDAAAGDSGPRDPRDAGPNDGGSSDAGRADVGRDDAGRADAGGDAATSTVPTGFGQACARDPAACGGNPCMTFMVDPFCYAQVCTAACTSTDECAAWADAVGLDGRSVECTASSMRCDLSRAGVPPTVCE